MPRRKTGDLITREEALALEYRHMTEAQFGDKLVRIATAWGWQVSHHDTKLPQGAVTVEYMTKKGPVRRRMRPRRMKGRGFPDYVLAKKGHVVIFAEIKSETGSLDADQEVWREVLENSPGVRYRLWRPRHMDEIEALLMEPEVGT
jgi:hypothetical protein